MTSVPWLSHILARAHTYNLQVTNRRSCVKSPPHTHLHPPIKDDIGHCDILAVDIYEGHAGFPQPQGEARGMFGLGEVRAGAGEVTGNGEVRIPPPTQTHR